MAVGLAVIGLLGSVLIVPGLIIVIAAAVSASRAERDPTGRRPEAIYLSATTFVALYLTLFGTLGVVVSLTSLIDDAPRSSLQAVTAPVAPSGPDYLGGRQLVVGNATAPTVVPFRRALPYPTTTLFGPPGFGGAVTPLTGPRHPIGDRAVTGAVGSGLVALAGALVLWFHGRRLWRLLDDAEVRHTAAGRPIGTYLYAAAFLAVFIAALAAASALWGVYRLVAPGVSGSGSGRAGGARELVDSAYLAAAAGAIFLTHWRTATRTRLTLRTAPSGPPPPGPSAGGGPGQPDAEPPLPETPGRADP